MDPVKETAAIYDEIAPMYDIEYQNSRDLAENEVLARRLNNGYLEGTMLDVGCGTGLVLDLLGPYIDPARYVGVDISHGMLEEARGKHPAFQFEVGDQHDLQYADGTFDAVVSTFGVWNHAVEPRQVLREFARVLRPDGHLFLMSYSLRHEHRATLANEAFEVHVPVRRYSSRQVGEMLAEIPSPWKDIRIEGMSWQIDGVAKRLGVRGSTRYLALERQVTRWLPDLGYHLIIEARRR